LVSDEITAADVSKNRPPSYQVILQYPTGRWGVMTNADGSKAARVRFYPSGPFAEHAAAAERARAVLISPANSTMAIP
jgi:hypothetical protein